MRCVGWDNCDKWVEFSFPHDHGAAMGFGGGEREIGVINVFGIEVVRVRCMKKWGDDGNVMGKYLGFGEKD